MPVHPDPGKVQVVLLALGIGPNDLDALRRLPINQARVGLETLKERVRKNFKHVAASLHPDRTGNDPEKTELFKLLGTVRDEFEKLQIQPPPIPVFLIPQQPPPMVVTRVVTWTSAGARHVQATSATTVTVGVPFRVATMKPR